MVYLENHQALLLPHNSSIESYLRWSEKLLERHIHAAEHLEEQEVLAGAVQCALSFVPSLLSR